MKAVKPQLLQTKTQWRKEGRGIRHGQEPREYRAWNDDQIGLYARSQTRAFKPYQRALTYLVDLFANYPEKFRYTTLDGEIGEISTDNLKGPAHAYLERGFDYEKCRAGIRVRKNLLAQSFHVFCRRDTQFLVIDLDNHHPTNASTEVHLELVQHLQDRMPLLLKAIGGRSSFVQYRGIEPTGLQLWIVLHSYQRTEVVHNKVRGLLLSLNQNGLDERLKAAGLPSLSQIEILPSPSHTVSMVGSYGKKVFTTKELKPTESRFNCIDLYRHIENCGVTNSFFERYQELVLVRKMAPARELPPQPIAPTVPSPETDSKKFWARLKRIALDGVQSPDELHDGYLRPLAQYLLLREYFYCSDRDQKTFNTLKTWVHNKHNGYVSRALSGHWRKLHSQIKSTIKSIHKKTNPKVLAYYQEMRNNDKRWPHRIERLEPLMLQQRNGPHTLLLDCKGSISLNQKPKKPRVSRHIPAVSWIPEPVIAKICSYAEATIRKGKMNERWTRFAKRVIAEIGCNEQKTINNERLMILAGKNPSVSVSCLKRWKKHLVAAGIINKGWDKNIIRGRRSSSYSLTPETSEEINNKGPSRRPKGRSGAKGGTRPNTEKTPQE
jgi:hypothetical protein